MAEGEGWRLVAKGQVGDGWRQAGVKKGVAGARIGDDWGREGKGMNKGKRWQKGSRGGSSIG